MRFSLSELSFVGSGLVRPECVLATKAGNLYVSDFRGGVTQIDAKGHCRFFGGATLDGIGQIKPNGICLQKNGDFLLAHLGDETGGVYTLTRDDQIRPWLTHIDNQALPPSNFIYLDHQGRYWLTVSTRLQPRAKAYRSNNSDGFIVVIDKHGARIVADNIGYANEVCVSPDGAKLYVNATFTRETLAFDIDKHNSLTNKRVLARYGEGIYPDGLALDQQNHLWVTSVVSNSIIRVNANTSEQALMLQDADSEHLHWVEQAYQSHEMGRAHLDNVKSKVLQNTSSLAFSGKDLQTLNLGCLLGSKIARLKSPYKGVPPSHWLFDSGLEQL